MKRADLVRSIVRGSALRDRINAGIESIRDVAKSSYGNRSGNVLIENRYGEPVISHDGITNVANLIVSDPVENAAISIVRQASDKTDQEAGDATTFSVLLTCFGYDYWSKKIAEGRSIREVQSAIDIATDRIISKLRKIKTELRPEDEGILLNVAETATGSEPLAQIVSEAKKIAGDNGSIVVVETTDENTVLSRVDGFSYDNGFSVVALADDMQSLKSDFRNPAVIAMARPCAKNDDIMPILSIVAKSSHAPIVLIGDVRGEALESVVANKISGKLRIAVIAPPAIGRDEFLNDIAMYSGTRVFSGDVANFDIKEHVGSVDEAHITVRSTTLNGSHNPDLANYAESVTDEARRKRLLGVTAKIEVGAPTEAERRELRLRVDDGVCAVETASTHGVIVGGGTAMKDISAELVDYKYLADASYDLLSPGKLSLADGVVDSAYAIERAIVNAHSAIKQLVSIELALPFANEEAEER